MDQIAIAVVPRIGEQTLFVVHEHEAVQVAVQMARSVERLTASLDGEHGLGFPLISGDNVAV